VAEIYSLTPGGAVTGSGTLTLPSKKFAGYKLNGDGTNTATLIIRDVNSSGPILVDTSTIQGEKVTEPMRCAGTIHYTVGGTGGDAMIYGWNLVLS